MKGAPVERSLVAQRVLQIVRKLPIFVSMEWLCLLAMKVSQLLQVANLEVATCKNVSAKLVEEKLGLNDHLRLQCMLVESSHAKVLQMQIKMRDGAIQEGGGSTLGFRKSFESKLSYAECTTIPTVFTFHSFHIFVQYHTCKQILYF